MGSNQRGASTVIGVVLMVALVVVLAATVSVFVLGFGEESDEPAPIVVETSGEFVPGSGTDEQVVRLTHIGGDTVDVENLEIAVRAFDPDGALITESRMVNLPGTGSTP